ncbi:phosphatase [Cellulosilyticum sp. WCF-2]|uniref:phosphatase n=1 Tax=Cellulosilyticum sp. WCF-2 TaxID=2497860 RepID=UPI000F8EFD0C|nr:phosphatase [Cellulosilyticum sp. WCF-2]QEH70156.1 phosphatase [Cellulosilyticum sp. WCF-2]
MKILADIHTHTIASGHAYSTITENIKAASEKGLKLIATTDHTEGMPGGAHAFHFANLRSLPDEIDGVKILRGAEANIIDYEGHLDVDEELLGELDMAIASFHPPCIDFADVETVTRGLEKVMQNPYISIIGHPGDSRYPLDFERIVKMAKATGTLLEVNNASLKPTSFRPGVRESLIELLTYCKAYEMPVVLGSDAHHMSVVGRFEESIMLLEELDFPETLVLNTNPEALVDFISQKRLK